MNKLEKLSLSIFVFIIILILLGIISPELIDNLNYFISHKFIRYYTLLGVLFPLVLVIVSITPIGSIKIKGKVNHSYLSWLGMIFSSTLAADIIYYSMIDWKLYDNLDTSYIGVSSSELSMVYPMLHWGVSAWSFYIVPAILYAYLKYNKSKNIYNISDLSMNNNHNRLYTPINSIGVLSMIIAISTTYVISAPLSSVCISDIVGINNLDLVTVSVIIIIGLIYSYIVRRDNVTIIKKVSNISCILYIVIVVCMLLSLDYKFIYNIASSSLYYLITNFVGLSLYISDSEFTYSYTAYYWSYWIVWSIATPFFIAEISRGRKIRTIAIVGTLSSVLSTYLSLIVMSGVTMYYNNSSIVDSYQSILYSISCLQFPLNIIVEWLLPICMVLMYVTTIDSVLYVMYKYINASKISMKYTPILLSILPVVLIYNNIISSSLQSLVILLAFPVSILLVISYVIPILKLIIRKE